MTTTRLMLAGGTAGRLVRRPSGVLFDPTGAHDELAATFDEADTDRAAIDDVKRHLIDGQFTSPPLVVVSWASGDLDLLIFGDVAIHTSAIAAPMVSGAGSGSWVERHISSIERGREPIVELWSGEDSDAMTNLRLGVVACAGFRLSVELPVDDAADSAQQTPTERTSPEEAPAEKTSLEEARSDEEASPQQPIEQIPAKPSMPADMVKEESKVADVAERPDVRPLNDREPASPHLTSAPPPPPVVAEDLPAPPVVDEAPIRPDPAPHKPADDHDSPAEADPIAAAAPLAAAGAVASPVAPPAPNFTDDEPTTAAPTPVADAPRGADPFAADAADAPQRVGLIEASHCQQGHPNPPDFAACYMCGISLIDDQSLSLIDQPVVGRVLFAGGQSVPIDRDMKLGRKPDAEDGMHPVIIDHAEVSRSHASVRVEGWKVLLTDLGSRNGTYVVPANDPTPVRLIGEVPHVLEHGTRVHVGGPEVAFTYLFDAGDAGQGS